MHILIWANLVLLPSLCSLLILLLQFLYLLLSSFFKFFSTFVLSYISSFSLFFVQVTMMMFLFCGKMMMLPVRPFLEHVTFFMKNTRQSSLQLMCRIRTCSGRREAYLRSKGLRSGLQDIATRSEHVQYGPIVLTLSLISFRRTHLCDFEHYKERDTRRSAFIINQAETMTDLMIRTRASVRQKEMIC